MKKLVLAAVAASMVAVPTVASAAPQRTVVKERGNKTVVVQRGGGVKQRTVVNRRGNVVRQNVRVNRPVVRQQQRVIVNRPTYSYNSWQRGQRFNRAYAPNYRQIDYRSYGGRGLYAPPQGYQWVQSGNDAVLVAVASGLIGAVLGGVLF
ncbi:RcnB family protein [Sphingomonas japonica]|uniref:Ni/Co efflux regulator RcnB n=1 Tax=Sphingomonas japonica TaxID=511662 RepID=A0ABX0U3Y6_9SPHN|nr:RcnB family protein [Sphingomonas japonica]NIJ24760.1 Ni/Co efflux regulator RcnB [Sphingomonas japonica]